VKRRSSGIALPPLRFTLDLYSYSKQRTVWTSDKEISLAFNRDDRYFAVGSPEWRALVLDLQTGQQIDQR